MHESDAFENKKNPSTESGNPMLFYCPGNAISESFFRGKRSECVVHRAGKGSNCLLIFSTKGWILGRPHLWLLQRKEEREKEMDFRNARNHGVRQSRDSLIWNFARLKAKLRLSGIKFTSYYHTNLATKM